VLVHSSYMPSTLSHPFAHMSHTIGCDRSAASYSGEELTGIRAKTKVDVGSVAPDFSLLSQSGEMVSLEDFIGKEPVVLFFYPSDDTPGCTKEACAFRDDYEEFGKLDAEVIGISSDSVESHKSFAAKYDLPFTMLSDEGGKVRKLYGVPNTLGLFPGRVTYVIDQRGVVRHVFSSQVGVEKHVEEALKALKSIGSQYEGRE
jgi:thioredoxin-dependent peroxiredoxin